MKIGIEGELYHAVPAPHGGCTVRGVRCSLVDSGNCRNILCSERNRSVVFFTDDDFTKWLTARLTK